MAENTILTQREIDSLLNGSGESGTSSAAGGSLRASATEGLAKTVKRYDFRRPDKFSKEHLRTLQAMHESFARAVASSLSNRLRTNAEIKVSSIDQGLYEEYVGQVPTPTFAQVINMAPLDGSILLEYSHDLGLAIVDRLLGGQGVLLERTHEVTEIELQLLRGLADTISTHVGEAWQNLAAITPSVTEVTEDIHAAQIAPPTEVVIMVFMEVTLLDVVAGLSMCTPFSVLEDVMPRLNAQAWVGTGGRKQSTDSSRLDLRRQIERTPAPISVELGAAEVSARDLATLATGDVIRLEGSLRRPVPVRVNGVRKWLGTPATNDGRLCVQIDRWAPEEIAPRRARRADDAPQDTESAPPLAASQTTEMEGARAA